MTLLIFLIVLSILIFVHELGHFWAARRAGIKVEEFGFGFPPRVWGKKIGETIYSINALPIGGFVRLYGEEADVAREKQRSFYHQTRITRATVVVAGVLMNLLLAVFAFGIFRWVVGIPTGEVEVVGVSEGSPAQELGIKEGDIVASVEGQEVTNNLQFIQIVEQNKGEEIQITLRNGQEKTVGIVPRTDPPKGEGALGVTIRDVYQPPFWQKPFLALREGVKETMFWIVNIIVAVGVALAQAIRGTAPEGLAGPVGIFQITGEVAQRGILNLISFLGILSANLAVINALPFPALDGGRLLFILVEGIFGRRVVPAVEKVAHVAGMILLLLLLLLITISDIGRLLSGGFGFLRLQ